MNEPPRRYWHDGRGAIVWLVLLLLAVWRAYKFWHIPAPPEQLAEGVHEVRRVVDGDTLLLANGARMRLQGVNTPETVKPNSPVGPSGPEASQITKDFIARANNRVRLTFSRERKDRYDRFLAFIWNGDTMLNEELVRAGLAEARLDDRFTGPLRRRLSDARDKARREGRGIWSKRFTEETDAR